MALSDSLMFHSKLTAVWVAGEGSLVVLTSQPCEIKGNLNVMIASDKYLDK